MLLVVVVEYIPGFKNEALCAVFTVQAGFVVLEDMECLFCFL